MQKIIDNIKLVYKYGYAQLYGEERAGWIIRFTLLSLALGVLNDYNLLHIYFGFISLALKSIGTSGSSLYGASCGVHQIVLAFS